MNIAVLGTGAMGCLFGSYLSRRNDVVLIGHNKEKQEKLDRSGIVIREQDGSECRYFPHAVSDCSGLPVMDLVLVFVRVMDTCEALEANRSLIGPDTFLLTLQNGAGHEERLLQYADKEHVVIGSTKHGSCVLEPGKIFHSGAGETSIGLLSGEAGISRIAEELSCCGFPCEVSGSIQKQIWDKLFVNTAASSLTAVLQVPLGFIYEDINAHALMENLVREAVTVANAEDIGVFEERDVREAVEHVIPSICTHLKTGQKTEVDYISGYVIRRAKAHGIAVPYHEAVVAMIHAMENRNCQDGNFIKDKKDETACMPGR